MLTEEEDKSIVAFIIKIERSRLPAFKGEIEDTANIIRPHRELEAKRVNRV
jgi:hypothetical protein